MTFIKTFGLSLEKEKAYTRQQSAPQFGRRDPRGSRLGSVMFSNYAFPGKCTEKYWFYYAKIRMTVYPYSHRLVWTHREAILKYNTYLLGFKTKSLLDINVRFNTIGVSIDTLIIKTHTHTFWIILVFFFSTAFTLNILIVNYSQICIANDTRVIINL